MHLFSIWFLLPAAVLVVRVVDIRTRKYHAILSNAFVPLARKVKCLSRSEVGPCDCASVSSLHDRCCKKLSGGALRLAISRKAHHSESVSGPKRAGRCCRGVLL